MRVVSQNGQVSIDFEDAIVSIMDRTIVAEIKDRTIILGRYETEERTKDLFYDMHNEWERELTRSPYAKVYYMPEE